LKKSSSKSAPYVLIVVVPSLWPAMR
jgi:hypothetical protein